MDWIAKLFRAPSHSPARLAPHESTKDELVEERRLRREQKDRTDRLATMLADYRRQDRLMRR